MKYPQTSIRGEHIYAHIAIYEHFVGLVPEGLTLDHLCRNTRCVRWDHVEPVTGVVNTLRGFNPMAQNARKTHCLRGHPLAGENLIVTTTGARRCRICRQVSWTKQNQKTSEKRRRAREAA